VTNEQREVLESLKECAGLLDQLLNGQSVPNADDVDAALLRARAAIGEVEASRQ
jgi:hypothetical protein